MEIVMAMLDDADRSWLETRFHQADETMRVQFALVHDRISRHKTETIARLDNVERNQFTNASSLNERIARQEVTPCPDVPKHEDRYHNGRARAAWIAAVVAVVGLAIAALEFLKRFAGGTP